MPAAACERPATHCSAAAREFVEALRPEDQLAVIFFSDGIVISHDFAKNRQEALEAIDAYKSAGGTALYDALASSLTMLKRQEGRRAVVVMTDGRDENNAGNAPGSRQTLSDVLNLAKTVDAAIFPIGLGSNVDRVGFGAVRRRSPAVTRTFRRRPRS